MQGQSHIIAHTCIFVPNEGCFVYCLSNNFHNTHGFENQGMSIAYSPFVAGEYSVT